MSTVYGVRRSPAFWAAWPAVKSHVLGQIGISGAAVKTEADFLNLTTAIYEIEPVDPTDFDASIIGFHAALNAMTKSRRKKLRVKNVGKIPYDVKPSAKAVQRAARKARDRAPSEKKQAAVAAYQKKHLVLVADGGVKVFNNVREHSAPDERTQFYASWEWRTLRMKVIKKFGRRCHCCGSTPNDVTVSGDPVRLVVDHIKPLSKYWQLRLVPTNLQILCDECNMGKGAWDETDHRSEAERLIAQQLHYEVA